jgi:DNA polymerase-3 subunit beta
MPVLANVLLEVVGTDQLRLAATDLFLSVSGTIAAQVDKGGSVAVGARDLFERVKHMPEGGRITISTNDNSSTTLRALGKPRRYTLHGMPGEDFPRLPEPDPGAEVLELSVVTLAQLMEATHFSISTDETRLHLNSALFEWDGNKVRMVSTDGHRLSKMECDVDGRPASTTMLIPLKGISELRRLCEDARAESSKGEWHGDIQLCQSGPTAFFRVIGVQFGVKLVDAQFPPYQQVIPASTSHQIVAPRDDVAKALSAVEVAASNRNGGIKVTIDRSAIRFSSESPDSGEGFDEVPVTYAGEPLTVGFNAKYFLDVIRAIQGDKLELGVSGELDPAVIRPEMDLPGTRYLAVIMPMRI